MSRPSVSVDYLIVTYTLPQNEAVCSDALQPQPPEAEPACDDLARLAAIVCDTPAAAIGVLEEDHVRCASRYGTSVPESGLRMVMDGAAATGETVCIVDGSMLCGLHIGDQPVRFLAVAPLRSGQGAVLGVMCVMDVCPRSLRPEQREGLECLARQAVIHLDLRRQARELERAVKELREEQSAYQHHANHDALTGLPSRHLFDDRLSQAMARSQRTGQPVAVMFVDLDGFKGVNDTWGHAVGDRLLQVVADRLRGSLRKSDTVARIGGDEFALICPDVHGPDAGAGIARKILAAVSAPAEVNGMHLAITASIGIALYPHDGATPGTLLMDADTAMYRAKRNGKNTYAFCPLANAKKCVLGAG